MNPTIYVITYHEFNHGRPKNPLSRKFLESDKNYVFYLIDKKIPPDLQEKQVILEYDLDPILHSAGGKHLGEWSFLLAEEKHAFCQYPFFMISSRFYEKNRWLRADLNEEWEYLFSLFHEYGWGYLPSYDRPMRWIDLSWEKRIKKKSWKHIFFPFTEKTFQLTKELFHVDIPKDYNFTADLFCNYIGFRTRDELLQYVHFYRPLFHYFFHSDYSLKTDLSPYVRSTGSFRNEKPFTFLLEFLCHLFFFKQREKYFALHYDGYYVVDEAKKDLCCIEPFPISLKTSFKRLIQWQWVKITSEGFLSRVKSKIKKQKSLYKIAKTILKR